MWIESFLRYVRYEKNYSSHTVLSYRRDLLQFRDYLSRLEGSVSLDSVERDHVRNWAALLIEEGNSSRTVARKFSALRTFYAYLLKQGVVANSPLQDITLPKIHKSLPSFVRPDEMDLLLDEKVADDDFSALRDKLIAALGDTERKNILDFRQLSMSGGFENGVFDISERFSGSSDIIDYGKITNLRIVSLSDYNRISGKSETLAENEVLLHALRTDYGLKTISLGSVETFTVKKTLDAMPLADGSGAEISPTITLVVSDFDKTAERLVDGAGEYVVRSKWICDFDCSDELEDQDKVCNMIAAASENGEFSDKDGSSGWQYLSYESRAAEYADFAAVYGGLFFLGVTLSLVFSCAAVLIIYYKQLSEGYEDAQRFEIMQKVGMTKPEIRRSINSQLLTVFFLPLIFAGLHLAFAFPFIRKILYMFSFYNTSFLVWTTVISFFVFAVLYALVYKKTSNTYYKIVS